MKSMVVYKSISGFTRRYAEWIAGELNAECRSLEEIGKLSLEGYEPVIFGGSLHAVGINGWKTFRRYIPRIGPEKVIVFSVGASPVRKGIVAELKSANFDREEEKDIPLFYLRGGFNFPLLDLKNKILMTLLKWKLSLKSEKTADERGMLAAYAKPLDTVKRENIVPIINHVKTAFPPR